MWKSRDSAAPERVSKHPTEVREADAVEHPFGPTAAQRARCISLAECGLPPFRL